MARTRKIRPGHLLAQVLCKDPVKLEDGTLIGREVPFIELIEKFRNELPEIPGKRAGQEYKISGYIGDIRKYDFGVVHVRKNGRDIVTVQLVNVGEFNPITGQNDVKVPPPPPAEEHTAVEPKVPGKRGRPRKNLDVAPETVTQTQNDTEEEETNTETHSEDPTIGGSYPIDSDEVFVEYTPNTSSGCNLRDLPCEEIEQVMAA